MRIKFRDEAWMYFFNKVLTMLWIFEGIEEIQILDNEPTEIKIVIVYGW